MSDEELIKQVCDELGIKWDDTPGYVCINGIPATEWIKNHDLWEIDNEVIL